MEYRCCVLGCMKTSNNGVGLHEFPFNNQALLPIWIMATNRSDWLPVVKSRICNRHFSIDDYEDGNKNNNLKSNACPMFNTPSNAVENNKVMTDSDISDVDISSTSDINFSDLNTDDLLDTPNTSDMKCSDDDSILSISSMTCNLNKTTGFKNEHFLPSNSYNQTEEKTIDIRSTKCVPNSVSLSSTEIKFRNIHRLNNNKCAVVSCNEKVRLKFDQLLFIDFPKDKELCDTWWKICGRNNTFDSSFKICSIHFDMNDFTTVTIKQGDQLKQQTILKNINIVPTLYLLPNEYTRLIRKRKNTITNNNKKKILNTSEIVNCSIQGCKKTSLKNEKIELFFKFPLENKVMLNKWLNNIGVPNWQPSETNRICSDHIEYYNINQLGEDDKKFSNFDYNLQINAAPSIKPKISKDSTNKGKELNFDNLHEDILIMEKNEMEKSNLFNSSRSIINHKQIFTTAAMKSDLTDRDATKEQSLVYSPKQFKKSNLEYFMDIYNNDSNGSNLAMNGGSQFQNNTTSSVTKLYLESFEKEIADESKKLKMATKSNENNLNNMCSDINSSNVNPINNIPNKHICSNGIKKTQMEFSEKYDFNKEINIIPKSKNNGNDRDYIYLDMLNGDDVGEFLTFEKKYIPKNTKSKVPELLEKKQTKGIPKSIISDSDLIECYGEMLPATCDTDCQLICYYSIPGPQRREIYNQFQTLHNVTEQNCKITQLVKLRMIKKMNETFECCPLYHLIMNSLTVKVCRTFFINTLGITENRLNGVLKPINYSWYSDKDTALKANLPKQVKVTGKSVVMTDFMRESLKQLDNDYNLYEPENDSEVTLENVPFEEYEKMFSYIKGIPRILSSYQAPGELKKQFFETSICLDYIYKSYSENYIRNNIPPPCTKRQFKIIYNQYMKTFLK